MRKEKMQSYRALLWLVPAGALLLSSLGEAMGQALLGKTQDPVAGSKVFGDKGCSRCHSINGVGGKIGPDLGRISRPRSFYDLAAAMWNHFPQMAAQMRKLGIASPYLAARATGDLTAFLFSVNYFDPPGDPKVGRKIFLQKRCVVCHQVGGTGGVIGPSLDPIAQSGSAIFVAAAMWNHGPAMAEVMRAKGIRRPQFTGPELRDLIAYLGSVTPQQRGEPLSVLPGDARQGRELFSDKRCMECHSIRGEGGRVGPDLAERGLDQSLLQFAAAMWNKAPAMLQEMAKRGVALPQLRPDEMADIIAYLDSVRYFAQSGDAGRGRELVAAKGCLVCHSVAGKGGQVGPDFERIQGLDQPVAVISALWNHAGTMERKAREKGVEWPLLKGGEMADLAAFLQNVGRAKK